MHLIDFGLATRYRDAKTDAHKSERHLGHFSGNFMFASINQICGYSLSRRDDCESAIYLLVYLLNKGTLPWSDFTTRYANAPLESWLERRQQRDYYIKLYKMMPRSLKKCYERIMCIAYNEEPPYDYIISSLNRCYEDAVHEASNSSKKRDLPRHIFEWNKTIGNRFRMKLIAQQRYDNDGIEIQDNWVTSPTKLGKYLEHSSPSSTFRKEFMADKCFSNSTATSLNEENTIN